jgi:carboxyl-terminal processing protease
VVEDPSSPSDSAMRMREADLDRHLSNGDEKDKGTKPEAKPDTESQSAPAKPKEEEKAEKREPTVFGSKDDYQLNQALNLLKGVNVMQTTSAK